jgi:hypothetical protein
MSPRKRAPIPMGNDISHPPAKIDATCMTVKSPRETEDLGRRKTAINEITPNRIMTSMMTVASRARLSIAEE